MDYVAALTIGAPGITLADSGTLVAQGLLTNAGTLAIGAGIVTAGTLTNTGTIDISGTGRLSMDSGSLTVGVTGTSGTILTSGNGALVLGSGVSLSGTINSAALTLVYAGAAMNDITLDGTMSLGPAASAVIEGTFTSAGANGAGSGTIDFTGGTLSCGSSLTLANLTLDFANGGTFTDGSPTPAPR